MICIHWMWIEDLIDDLVSALLGIDDSDVRNTILGNADLRGKIQMVKALAIIQGQHPSWIGPIIKTLDYIDNDLRVRRNAHVHARWYGRGNRLGRRRKKTIMKRPQARQVTLETEEDITIPISQLRRLDRDLKRTAVDLYWLLAYALLPTTDEPTDAKPSRAITFQQFLRRAKRGGYRSLHERSTP
jgi:hypothetical protein